MADSTMLGMMVLTQLEGSAPKTIYLAGNAAPHGRPRKGAVVEAEATVRQSAVYYAGDAPPTRHIFGSKLEPIKMKGRFRDSGNGKGFARAKMRELLAFFHDKRQIAVVWGDLYDVVGLMVKCTPKIEAAEEIEYEIEVEVDVDRLADKRPTFPKIKGPKDITDQIIASLKLKDKLAKTPAMKGSVVDLLGGLVGSLNSASALLVQSAEDLDSFATGTVAQIQRFRAGLAQTRVAVQKLRGTYDSMLVTAALENEAANNTQPFWDLQAGWASSSLEALRLLAAAERETAVAQQGKIKALHEAALGDTWDSISIQYFETAHRADEIRETNDVPPGTDPVPGTLYVVPR